MSSQAARYVFSRILCTAVLCLVLPGKADVPLPPDLPAVVLWTSVDFCPAEDEARAWRARGITGATLTGTADAIRTSASVLIAAGVAHNFVRFDPGAVVTFGGDGARPTAIEKVRTSAETAHSMGMAGVVFDLTDLARAKKPGIGSDMSPIELEGVRTWGRLLAEAVLDAMPKGTVLVLIPPPGQASSAIISALLGMCDEIAAHRGFTIHLIVPGDATPDEVRGRITKYRRLLNVRGAGEVSEMSLVFDLSLGLSRPKAALDDETKRERIIEANIGAESYVFLSPDSVPARANDTPKLRDSCVAPLANLVRAGVAQAGGNRAEVLCGKDGAALAFLSGTRESFQLMERALPVRVIDLRTFKSQTISPNDGALELGPFAGPMLVDRLQVSNWVVPSSLWLERGTVPPGPVHSIPVAFGWANRTALRFTGTLETVVPKGFSLLPRTQVIDLEPGESVVIDGTLQGRATRGTQVDIRLVLTSPGGAPAAGNFAVPVPPDLFWNVPTGWSCDTPPALVDLDGDESAEVVAGTRDALRALDGSGHTLWQVPVNAGITTPPVGARRWSGRNLVAVGSSRGVEAFGDDGSTLWCTPVPGDVRVIRTGNLTPFPGEELVVGTGKGVVSALLSNGQVLWSALVDGPVSDLDVEDVDGDGRDECLVLSGGLTALDEKGHPIWTAMEGAAPTQCPLLIADLSGDWNWDVVVGFDDGRVTTLNAGTGETVNADEVPAGPIVGIACGELLENPGQELLVATARSLYCLSQDLTILWAKAFHVSAAPTAIGEGEDARILVPTRLGDLVCLDARGQERWRDKRAGDSIPFTPSLVFSNSGEAAVCMYGSLDGHLRAIQLPG